MRIDIKFNDKQLQQSLKRLSATAVSVAGVQAMNKTAKKVEVYSVRELKAITGLKSGLIKRDIKLVRANKNTLTARVDATQAKATNLIETVAPSQRNTTHFRKRLKSGKYKHSGVTAKFYGKRMKFEGAFIAKGRSSGKLLVFKRSNSGRLKSVHNASPRVEFIKPAFRAKVNKKISTEWPIEFNRAVRNQIRKAGFK